MPNELTFFADLAYSLQNQTFIKCSLSKYYSSDVALKNIYAKPVKIKSEIKISVTFHHKTNDQVKNLSNEEFIDLMKEQLGAHAFSEANVLTSGFDLKYEIRKNGKISVSKSKPTLQVKQELTHNKEKKRILVAEETSWMTALKLTDSEGKVFKNAQDKFKQINHYIELVSPEIKQLSNPDYISVVDMGSGKGYLTFALYDYLTKTLGKKAKVKGVELRTELVELCNEVAKDSNCTDLEFHEGSIQDFALNKTDILVALHACDTATDDAILKGIKAHAELIVVAPCCHKQIRREMEKGECNATLQPLVKHGIFLERQAEMLTDTIRALILENNGYQVKVMQFISDVHTPKNVLITAIRKPGKVVSNPEILQKIASLKELFGIKEHYLETLLAE